MLRRKVGIKKEGKNGRLEKERSKENGRTRQKNRIYKTGYCRSFVKI
jgi:hypothetical protein